MVLEGVVSSFGDFCLPLGMMRLYEWVEGGILFIMINAGCIGVSREYVEL